MIILTDITKKILIQEQIEFLSYHDSLTSLFNRAYIKKIISDLKKTNKLPIGLLFGDMNGLKLTNDVFGHHKGDELLISMANILKQCCWEDEIIVRWSGDEFVILVFKASQEICEYICKRIKTVCSQSRWDPIGPSIAMGIALQEEKEVDFDELFKQAEKNMYKNKMLESRNIKKQIILSMEKILTSKCFEYPAHIDKIQVMAVQLSRVTGIIKNESDIERIKLLAKLHDIGKVAIPTELLGKTSPLITNEWEIIKTHSDIGFRLVQSINYYEVAMDILYIHERWDGKGYPERLKGDQIPILSRIIAIVEAFDAMTNDRPFRNALTKEEGLEELKCCSGSQFDPTLVELFIKHEIYAQQHEVS